jgi:hypothetical protein
VNAARRGIGYLIVGIVMLTGTGILFFAPCASSNSAAAINERRNDRCSDDRRDGRDERDDFRFRSSDRRRRHRRENNDDYENDNDDSASFRSPSTVGNHVQNTIIASDSKPSTIHSARGGFLPLKLQPGSAKMAARSGTWPTVAASMSPTDVEVSEVGYYGNGGGVGQLQSPISAVDKVADFLRRKCATVGNRSASAVPYLSQDSTVNDSNVVVIGKSDKGRRSHFGDRV